MNNSYLLKKQLKDNEEELSNYLRDMNIWKDQMKRKEHSSPLDNHDEKKSKIGKNQLLSCDYSAWDKFDADNACKEIDVRDKFKKNNNSSENLIYNKLQSKMSEALYEKKLGNALVQKEKWAEAIIRYTRAIDYYDKDPIFYANRALCYLKINEFKLAINDCTTSLKLDSSYVKTYQRRSAAYMALELYDEAKKDLNYILKLEPNNMKAKIDIETINNKIKQNVIQKNSVLLENSSLNNLCNNVENPIKNVLPHWPLRPNCKQITSKQKPPHLRSKKPYCTLEIKDIQIDQEELNNIHLLQTTLKEVCEKNHTIISVKEDVVQNEKKQLVIPPLPQTYVQLKKDWAYLQKDSKLLFQYLKKIPGKRLPLIIRNSMDHDLFVDMLRILKLEFIQNGHEVTDYLMGISELPRIQMLVMFCSDDEVLCLKELLNHVTTSISESDLKSLKRSFGV